MGSKLSNLFRGLYFIRFSIAIWAFMLIFFGLDAGTSVASITRAILTPELGRQAFSAAFMLFSAGQVILLTVRLVALNGAQRFACELNAHHWLVRRWGQPHMPVRLFLLAHAPGALMFGYLAWNMRRERVPDLTTVLAFMGLGVLAGYVFWLLVGAFYWWTFDPAAHPGRGPRALLFPRRFIPLPHRWIESIQQSAPPPLMQWLDPLFRLVASRGGNGLAEPQHGNLPPNLYEGHRLASFGIFGLLLLYIYLFAFTAPVALPVLDVVCNVIVLVSLIAIFAGVVSGPWPAAKAPRVVKGLVGGIIFLVLVMIAGLWVSGVHAPRGFSVLASVMVLVIGFFWFLAGIAFLSDASRFPVLSGVILALFLVKLIPIYRTEHYFSVKATDNAVQAPQPAAILQKDLSQGTDPKSPFLKPLIIVTAEGGGIHSAAWTAAVLMELEQQFAYERPSPISFHDHILLASGVSGGSVGLLPFLREYQSDAPFNDREQAKNRVVAAAKCSSLQGVAWGLTYYDALNFLLPIPLWHANGVAWQDNAPEGFDRSWSLERALARNLADRSCAPGRSNPMAPTAGEPNLPGGYDLTLAGAAQLLTEGRLPAFTFNTTVVETGGRFLLANYELPAGERYTGVLPAESFLQVFDEPQNPVGKKKQLALADLPLPTAARLSATFPYISSASRVPEETASGGYHFVDGGYFDNDGTSSVVEFLHYALADPTHPWSYPNLRLPVLLIEIRNDQDLNAADNLDSFEHQEENGAKWGPFHQVIAPPIGFWDAGHKSDTRRNRREVCMMEKAFQDQLLVHHMVFDYRDQENHDEVQPLSWELTSRQQADIECAIDPEACKRKDPDAAPYAYRDDPKKGVTIHQLADAAAAWFAKPTDHAACAVYGRGNPGNNPVTPP
jgi:hypothetical protein